MKRVLVFFVSTIILLGFVRIIGDTLPSVNPFADDRPYQPLPLKDYGSRHIAGMKIRQATERDSVYDLGLFGNSRIIGLGRDHLHFGSCTIFNFAVPGESFRSSVRLIEALASQQALPKTAVISFDHFELQMYSNPLWGSFWNRLNLLMNDVEANLGYYGGSPKYILRIIWRFFWTEKLLFQQQFEFALFGRALANILGFKEDMLANIEPGNDGYLPDGSRYQVLDESVNDTVLPRTTGQIVDAQLESDVTLLFSSAVENSLDLVVFETPLNAASAKAFSENPSPFAERNRRILADACTKFDVRCILAPGPLANDNSGWGDASHPPPKVLTEWLKPYIVPHMQDCIA